MEATQEEIEIRKVEGDHTAVYGQVKLRTFAESLARSGREAVRFERYLVRQGFYPKIPKDEPFGLNR